MIVYLRDAHTGGLVPVSLGDFLLSHEIDQESELGDEAEEADTVAEDQGSVLQDDEGSYEEISGDCEEAIEDGDLPALVQTQRISGGKIEYYVQGPEEDVDEILDFLNDVINREIMASYKDSGIYHTLSLSKNLNQSTQNTSSLTFGNIGVLQG
jgi:hypothetical protein